MQRYQVQYQMDEESPDTTVVLVEKHQTVEKVLRKKLRTDLKMMGLEKSEVESAVDTLVILECIKV